MFVEAWITEPWGFAQGVETTESVQLEIALVSFVEIKDNFEGGMAHFWNSKGRFLKSEYFGEEVQASLNDLFFQLVLGFAGLKEQICFLLDFPFVKFVLSRDLNRNVDEYSELPCDSILPVELFLFNVFVEICENLFQNSLSVIGEGKSQIFLQTKISD